MEGAVVNDIATQCTMMNSFEFEFLNHNARVLWFLPSGDCGVVVSRGSNAGYWAAS